MRAIRMHEPGEPDVLKLEDVQLGRLVTFGAAAGEGLAPPDMW